MIIEFFRKLNFKFKTFTKAENLFRPYYKLRDWSYGNEIILVYSMGKVGSSTLYHTLAKRLPTIDIFHAHFLSDYWLKEILPSIDGAFYPNIEKGLKIREYLNLKPNKKIKIITLVREPISREVSDIFQNFMTFTQDIESTSYKQVISELDSKDYSYVLNWFDSEMKNFLGFDIYAFPFNKEAGYQVYNHNGIEILCLKLEKLNHAGVEALKRFLSFKNLIVYNSNISQLKKGNALYNKVKKEYKIKKEKAEDLYNSKYVNHFYSGAEIEIFKKRWSA